MAARDVLIASALTGATALVGGLATDVDSAWYRGLRKPPFQPPGALFGIAWTVLYALVAASATRVLGRAPRDERGRYLRSLVGNLALNAGWSWIFFRGHSTAGAVADAVALQVSNVGLAARTRRTDPLAAVLLAPYLLWVGFACVLSGELLRRNR